MNADGSRPDITISYADLPEVSPKGPLVTRATGEWRDRLGTIALVCGAASVGCFGLLLGPVAIVAGVVALLSRTRRPAQALAGIVLALVGILVWSALVWALFRVRNEPAPEPPLRPPARAVAVERGEP